MAQHHTIPQFGIKELNVPGAKILTTPVYKDSRGFLFEAMHVLKMDMPVCLYSVRAVYPERESSYGPLSMDTEQFVIVTSGKLFVSLIDYSNHDLRDTFEAVPGLVVHIPPKTIHSFLSLENDTVMLVAITSPSPVEEYKWDDENLKIEWPEGERILRSWSFQPSKPVEEKRPDYAIMGSTGMIGSAFVREIEKQGKTWYRMRSRLQQYESIRNELLIARPTVSVIIAAGVGTRPNTKWCDDHKLETMDANVTSQLAISRMCKELGLHCTMIGTGGFYHYDAEHPLDSGKGFDEEDAPNHEPNFYYKMRVYQEKLLNESDEIKHVLNLRALFPFDHKLTSASLIGKLLGFSKINSIKSSMTVLPELVPLALKMMEGGEVGHVNWVCEGTASNGDVLRAYQEIVDSSITINEVQMTQEASKESGNSATYMQTGRLAKAFGADKVPKLEDAIKKVMEMIKTEREETKK